jgi:hypothetical protein
MNTISVIAAGDMDKGLAEVGTPAKAMIDDLLWWTAARNHA